MRHIHIKPNISSNKSNVSSGGSSSGSKQVTSIAQKSGGGGGAAKRIHSDPVKTSKKKKEKEKNLTNVKCLKVKKYVKKSDGDKSEKKKRKKYKTNVVTKKSNVTVVKKIKKTNEKLKKLNLKSNNKKTGNGGGGGGGGNGGSCKKIVKKCKVSDKNQDNDGPPTLCETFSRITTMVAETVINEKENQRLTESFMGKVKRESDGSNSSKNKGETNSSSVEVTKYKKNSAETDASKIKVSSKKGDPVKKLKGGWKKTKIKKMKSEPKKNKSINKKTGEKATLDHTENLIKVLKDEEISLAFGKGIGTRRKSTAGSTDTEHKSENPDGVKSKTEMMIPKLDKSKKKITGKALIKKATPVKKEKSKSKIAETQSKKSNEDGKKNSDKGKDDQSTMKEIACKSSATKKDSVKTKLPLKKKTGKIIQSPKKKISHKGAKSPKSKFGSETDGSNSDELTLNILQKKTKKSKLDAETNTKGVKFENENKIKTEDKSDDAEKIPKSKKVKAKKEEKGENSNSFYKKNVDAGKDKKLVIKETESDTDEDMELKRIMAKKLGRSIKTMPDVKKKKSDVGKTTHDPEQRAKRLRLFGFWSGPKRHRVASLNALAKVHCLYENESKGVLAEIEKLAQVMKPDEKKGDKKDGKLDKKSISGRKSGKDSESEKIDGVVVNKRILRGTPGTRGAGKHWDMFAGDSTTSLSSVSSDESHSDTDKPKEKKLPLQPSYRQKMLKKESENKRENSKTRKRRRNNEIGLTMDLKDMVVRKRMASLNASAILAASYSTEKRSGRKDSSGTSTEDGSSSNEDSYRYSTDDRESATGKTASKKSTESDKQGEGKNKESEPATPPECVEYRHKKHFWKTKVESLKKTSKEKRNSPSPILAEFALEKDLSTKVFEKEKNDEINVDKEKDKVGKLGYPLKKFIDGKLKGKTGDGKYKSETIEMMCGKDDKKKYLKRKFCEENMKNINIEKMSGKEKTDEYEYKSDSDNGQRKLIELRNTGGSNKKVAVIVNQDTDVTITGVYVNSTRSTHHEGFCSIAGMQYRISSTSHTQTEATAVLKTSTASEQTLPPTEPTNCSSPRIQKSYTPLSALSNMQPPAGAPPHTHLPPPPHHHHHLCGIGQHRPPPDHYMSHGSISHQRPMSILSRRHGCSSAFTAPHCSSHPAPGGSLSPASDGEGFGSPLPSHGE